MSLYVGVELGSTRIKAVGIDEKFNPVLSGDYSWKSDFLNGIWTYPLEKAIEGLKVALKPFEGKKIDALGVSAMMHGYLAFDKDWNLLVPFRTWQNTMTKEAADELSGLFNFNIPQRWSIAHLYQAILNKEEHIDKIAHITTLAGYIHYRLTGVNALGVGEASGMFPIDSRTNHYNGKMLVKFNVLLKKHGLKYELEDILPAVLQAGEDAGKVTEAGNKMLDGLVATGTRMVPPEGDAGTGMVATNAVRVKTGNVSAGTSIFSMVVLEDELEHLHEEIDMVTTPAGKPVAMVHCNNCTNESNQWVGMFKEIAELFTDKVDVGELYTKLYKKSLEGKKDCDSILTYNYMAGEAVTGFNSGRPLIVRKPESEFNLANFMRSQLYATMATLKIGMDILAEEKVSIDCLMGHGGLFKTEGVGAKYLAAACNCKVANMETAGEGGPYGMAILASYLDEEKLNLEDYLDQKVFSSAKKKVYEAEKEDIEGFNQYLEQYKKCLAVEKAANENL